MSIGHVWSPKVLFWMGLSKTQCPACGFGVPMVFPGPFWRFGVTCFAEQKGRESQPLRLQSPKSLKSYFLDLQSLWRICNPLGPSGNKCRMQHILLLSRNSSFQLIERFAINDDPLQTTKASAGFTRGVFPVFPEQCFRKCMATSVSLISVQAEQ